MHVGAVSILEGAAVLRRARAGSGSPTVRELVLSRSAADAALPAAADARPVRPGPADLGRRRPLRHHLPRPPHRVAPSRVRGSSSSRSPPASRRGCSTASGRCGSSGSSRGSRTATSRMIQKTHHSLIDGVSGVDVATLLLDMSARLRAAGRRRSGRPSPRRPRRSCCSTRLRERVTEPAEIVRSVRSMLRGPRHAIERARELAQSMGTMVTRDSIAPRTSINGRTGPAPAACRSCASRSPR